MNKQIKTTGLKIRDAWRFVHVWCCGKCISAGEGRGKSGVPIATVRDIYDSVRGEKHEKREEC